MIPQRKKSAEEIAALREGMGLVPEVPVFQKPIEEIESSVSSVIIEQFREPKPVLSLRKHELPLAPAHTVYRRTALPSHRSDPNDLAEIRKREALAKLNQPSSDPVAHIRKQTASRLLCGLTYLLAIASPVMAFLNYPYIASAALLIVSLLLVIFLAWKKPRSRHHAALIFIIIFMTLAFGGLHYAPLFYVRP